MSASQRAPNFFKDAILLIAGVKFMRGFGLQPTSVYGGTAVGFFAGNMAGVYGFDARETLKAIANAQGDSESKVTLRVGNKEEQTTE